MIEAKELTLIKGWGVDSNPNNDPTYPMKHHTAEEHDGYSWDRPSQQPVDIEVLHSNERKNLTAVFGTSVPPSGLSGKIRRYAFKFSEGSYGHWLPLMLADRVNVVEGLFDDFKRGYIPNIFAERGMKAQWKYNKKEFIRAILAGTALLTSALAIAYRKKNLPKEILV